FGVPRLTFAFYEVAGVCLWAGFWAGLGYVFSDTVEMVARRASRLGHALGAVVVGALIAYVVLKYIRRQLFLRKLRIARIAPEELKRRLDAGEDVMVLDLRTALGVSAAPYVIPGAQWIATEALEARLPDIPKDRDLVLYCT